MTRRGKRSVGSRMGLVAGSSLAGTAVEWYDFFLYGTAATLVFNELFYPDGDPFVNSLLSLGTFAAGFIARPLGAIVLGHVGDQKGRRATLIASLMLMGVATFLIAFLPTYQQIGVTAPLLLLLLRLVQGFALGGEWSGSILLVSEHADNGSRRAFWSSLPNLGPSVGSLLSAGVMSGLAAVTTGEQFLAWGWRIAFGLSALLVVVGLVLRLYVEETPVFAKAQAAAENAKTGEKRTPLAALLRNDLKVTLLAAGTRMGENTGYYLYTVFIMTYVTDFVGSDRQTALNAVMVGQGVAIVLIPTLAILCDKIGRKPILMASAILTVPWGFAFFALLDQGSTGAIVLAAVGGLVIFAGFSSAIGAFYSELFPTGVRYTGTSVAYNASSILAGGLAPVVGLALYQATGTGTSIALYLAGMGVISVLCIYFSKETRDVQLSAGGQQPVPTVESEHAKAGTT
ncbi:MFS transporter [Streptomyces sp. NRRL F-4711]|uniref:MFS transporter n=1 Tax=unclassified Streptomyces TaxID=2593676 RepID=UPI0004BF582A|nr:MULTISPECIES: MFS transporter [unclassified Streptomyces]KOT92198.1 MFS transporter [Streptomyces sp. NRRL F-4711]